MVRTASIMQQMNAELRQEDDSSIAGVEIRWRLDDHHQYHGNIQDMLDQACWRLFNSDDDQNHCCQIELATAKV